jgi:hypothetical protein
MPQCALQSVEDFFSGCIDTKYQILLHGFIKCNQSILEWRTINIVWIISSPHHPVRPRMCLRSPAISLKSVLQTDSEVVAMVTTIKITITPLRHCMCITCVYRISLTSRTKQAVFLNHYVLWIFYKYLIHQRWSIWSRH